MWVQPSKLILNKLILYNKKAVIVHSDYFIFVINLLHIFHYSNHDGTLLQLLRFTKNVFSEVHSASKLRHLMAKKLATRYWHLLQQQPNSGGSATCAAKWHCFCCQIYVTPIYTHSQKCNHKYSNS